MFASVGALLVVTSAASASAQDSRPAERVPEAERQGFPVGDWTFRPSVEARVRAEYRRNAMNDGIFGEHAVLAEGMPDAQRQPIQDQILVWERVRLGLGVDYGALTAQVTFQDVRALGTPTRGTALAGQPNLPITEPYEGYLDIHTVDRDVFFRLGRQAIEIGDGRLIGISEDRAPGRSLDAARIFGKVGDFDLQAFAALVVFPGDFTIPNPGDENPGIAPGAQLYVMDATWHVAPFFNAELTGIARVTRQPLVDFLTPSDTFVAAARVFGDYRGVKYSVMGAFEGGRVAREASDENMTHIAGAVAGRVDWETSLPWHLTFGAEGAYATGDPADGTDIGVFDPILPDTTKNFGQQDFYALSNLIEGGADVAIKPVDEFWGRIGYRFAGLANAKGPWNSAALFPYGDAPNNDNQILGHILAVDLVAHPWKPLKLLASYGLMVLGDGAKAIYLDSRPGLEPDRVNDFAEFFGLDAQLILP